MVYNPLSTGITYQLIPKAAADKIPLYRPGYGRTSARNGAVFEWVFNAPANYRDGASGAITYLLNQNDGDLSGKKITLIHLNSAYGKEPIRTLEDLSEKHGFSFNTLPVDAPGQEQKSQWLQIRRDWPDYVLMWGWGVMNQTAIQEAANIRFPMENFIGSYWSASEVDVLPVGAGADGCKALIFHGVGTGYPLYDEMRGHVIAEAIAKAQEMTGTSQINAVQLRDAFEALDPTPERLVEIGLPDFGPEIEMSCENHGGSGKVRLQQRSATDRKWTLISEFIEPDQDVPGPLVAEDSEAYAKEAGIEPRC